MNTTIQQPRYANLIQMFAKARVALDRPKMVIQRGNEKVTIKYARKADDLKFPAMLYITVGDEYVGMLLKNGSYIHAQSSNHMSVTFHALFARLDTDPLAVSRVQGREYGQCMFCGIELSNPSSVYHSYGPICARKWGLPWGDTDEVDVNVGKFPELDDLESAAQVQASQVPAPSPSPSPSPITVARIDQRDINRTIRALQAQLVELDLLVLGTPTGAQRDGICDAVIHINAAIEQLLQIIATEMMKGGSQS